MHEHLIEHVVEVFAFERLGWVVLENVALVAPSNRSDRSDGGGQLRTGRGPTQDVSDLRAPDLTTEVKHRGEDRSVNQQVGVLQVRPVRPLAAQGIAHEKAEPNSRELLDLAGIAGLEQLPATGRNDDLIAAGKHVEDSELLKGRLPTLDR